MGVETENQKLSNEEKNSSGERVESPLSPERGLVWSWQFDPLDADPKVEITYGGKACAVAPTINNAQLLCERLNRHDAILDFKQWHNLCAEIRNRKAAMFPEGSVVAVESERFHGLGIVSFDETCPLEKLAVRVESLNVWWYPIEDCSPYAGKMSSWMRGHMRRQKTRRTQATATSEASANNNRTLEECFEFGI